MLGGTGEESRAEAVAGEGAGIEAGAGGAALKAESGAAETRSSFPTGRKMEPVVIEAAASHGASTGDSRAEWRSPAPRLPVGLAATDPHAEAVADFSDVLNLEGDQLGAPRASRGTGPTFRNSDVVGLLPCLAAPIARS
jgi:hypothetical protein